VDAINEAPGYFLAGDLDLASYTFCVENPSS